MPVCSLQKDLLISSSYNKKANIKMHIKTQNIEKSKEIQPKKKRREKKRSPTFIIVETRSKR